MQLRIPDGDFEGMIFDLDGTLIDSMPLHFLAWDRTMRLFGLRHQLDEDYFYDLGGVPTRRVAELFGERYGLSLDADAVVDLKERFYLELLPNVQVIAPVVEAARAAAGRHPISIATGGAPDVVFPALEFVGLRSLFRVVVTPHDVAPGRGKPAPDMFLLAAERMGVAAERCLVFEDAEPGLVAAQAAGMATVRVPSRKRRSGNELT